MPPPRSADPVLRDLGARLRAARTAAKLTQEQVAERAGIDSKRLQRIEAGANITIRTLDRIVTAIGTTIWQLADVLPHRGSRRSRS